MCGNSEMSKSILTNCMKSCSDFFHYYYFISNMMFSVISCVVLKSQRTPNPINLLRFVLLTAPPANTLILLPFSLLPPLPNKYIIIIRPDYILAMGWPISVQVWREITGSRHPQEKSQKNLKNHLVNQKCIAFR